MHDHTNSFPDVLPAKESSLIANPLAKSQAEDILKKNDDIEFSDNDQYDLLPPESPSQGSVRDFLRDDKVDFAAGIGSLQDGSLETPPDDEARYEEGLPLVPGASTKIVSEQKRQDLPEGDSVFSPVPNSIDDDFFDNITSDHGENQKPTFPPRPLDRKTTSQVLGDMTYLPHNETHNEIQGPKDQQSSDSFTGEGVAVSPSESVFSLR